MAKRPMTAGEDDGLHDPLLKGIAATLRRARLAAGLTQEELGDRIEATKYYVSQLERGGTNVSVKTLGKIAAAVGLHPREFLPLDEAAPVTPDVVRQLQRDIKAQKQVVAQLDAQLDRMDSVLASLFPAGEASPGLEATG